MGIGSKLKSAGKKVGGLAGGALGIGGGLLGLLDAGASKEQGSLSQNVVRDSRTERNLTSTLQRNEQRDITSNTSNLSDTDLLNLQNLIATTTGQLSGEISTGIDFDAIREAALTGVMQQGIGDVIAQGTNAGAYAGTPQATAAERLGAQAAVVGTQAETQARLQEQQQLQTALGNFLNTLSGARSSTQQSDTSKTDETKTEKEITENRSLESTDQKNKGTKYELSTPEKQGGALGGLISNILPI